MDRIATRIGLAAAIAAVVALMAVGAAVGARSSSQASSKTLVVDTSFGLQTLDPTFGQTLTRIVSHARWSTLMTYIGGNLTPKPLLATSFKASPRNKVFTFHLRKDAHFSDGTPLTSADVLFSYNRAINMRGDGASLLPGITVSAPDAYTVVLTSNTPNAAIPAIVTSPLLSVMNAKVAAAHGATDAANAQTADTAGQWLSSPASQGASSGPYTLAQYDTNSQIILGRNVKYWGPRPAFDKIVIRNVPSQTQALNVQKGTMEVALDLGAQEAAPLKSDKNLTVFETLSPQTFLFFSNNSPAVSSVSPNKHLQQAIRYAIDYKAIVDLAGGAAAQASGAIPAFFPGALQPADGTKRDLTKAKSELAASGLSNPTITIEYPSDRVINGLPFGSVAQIIQQNLQDAGIKVNLAGEPVVTVLGRYLKGQIPWGIVPNLPSVDDVTELIRLLPGGFLGKLAGSNAGSNPPLERAALKARLTPGDARLPLWESVQHQMNDAGPWIGLVNPTAVLVSTKDITGVAFNPQWTIDFGPIKPA